MMTTGQLVIFVVVHSFTILVMDDVIMASGIQECMTIITGLSGGLALTVLDDAMETP